MNLEDVRIIISGLWIATMLTYLLGDVLRLFSGDATPGEIDGAPMTQAITMTMAVIMLIPILMLIVSLTVPYPLVRWVIIIVAVVLILFNIAGLPYKGAYDNFLIVVSLAFKSIIIWYAWKWIPVGS